MELDFETENTLRVQVNGSAHEFARTVAENAIKMLEESSGAEDVRMVLPGDPDPDYMATLYLLFTQGDISTMLTNSGVIVEAGSPDPEREYPNGFRFRYGTPPVHH